MGTNFNQNEIDSLLYGNENANLSFEQKNPKKSKDYVANVFSYCTTCESSTIRNDETCPYCKSLVNVKKPIYKRVFKSEELVSKENGHYEKRK